MASNRNELWHSLAAFKTGNNEKMLANERFDLTITNAQAQDGTVVPVASVTITLRLAESQTQQGGLGYEVTPQPAPTP